MSTDDIRQRERDERATYHTVGSEGGRSAADDQELRLPDATIERYRQSATGVPPRFPLEQMVAWSAPLTGRRVLEICGHTGEHGAILARLGAVVDTVDIAEALVRTAQRRAAINGVEGRLRPAVMSIHDLGFATDTFDVVFGEGALHHLDLAAARSEIHRVLRPGGIGVFAEPIVLNPLLRFLRPLVPVPVARESSGERQLQQQDLDQFCQPFPSREFAYYRLFSRLERIAPGQLRRLASLDAWLLHQCAPLRRLSGICVMRLTKGPSARSRR
jgi:SAM-dependent methyltransferase